MESFEGQVIRGLSKTIAAFKPVISMEWNNQRTVNYFHQYNIFENELEDYCCFSIYRRWSFDLWPGILGKVRRKINKIFARKGHSHYLAPFDRNIFTSAVFMIPKKYTDIIALLQAAYPLVAI